MGTFILSHQGQGTPAAAVLQEIGLIRSPKINSLLVKQLFPRHFPLCSHLIFMFSETFFKPIQWWESSMWWLHQSGKVLNHSPLVSIRNLFISSNNNKKQPRPPWQFVRQCWLWKGVIFDPEMLPGADDCLTERPSSCGPQGAAHPPGPAQGCLGRGKRTFFHPDLKKRFEICSVFILIACLPWRR